jgi:hypothetical protein
MKDSFNERVLSCRFYDGTDAEPTDNEYRQFWGYESMWAHSSYCDNWKDELIAMAHYGVDKALANIDTPESLKCLLFNRYAHWIGFHDGNADGFVKWFTEMYASHPTNRVKLQRTLDCRYYNGEKECPLDGMKACYWDYERVWVTENINLKVEIEQLESMGVIKELHGEGTPIDMLGILYNRYVHWNESNGTLKSVCNWIRSSYQKQPTHRQLRKIRRISKLIPKCRFYHGESSCPYTDTRERTYWTYESIWVDKMSDSYTFANEQKPILKHFPKTTKFCIERGIPQSLVALFINREEHWTGYIESEDVYIDGLKRYYLKEL